MRDVRIGVYVSADSTTPLELLLARFEAAERRGFATAWTGHGFDWDALTVLALAATRTRQLELGTWVVPTPPRHPSALAQQALSVQSASGNRLALGIGVSHAAVVAERMGLDHRRPLRHMNEYLQVLRPLLAGRSVRHEGQVFRVALQLGTLGSAPPPVLLAALGPEMLALAGRLADGAAIWLGGPRFLEELAVPRLRSAAREAGRPSPRIACGLTIALARDAARAREAAEAFLARSARLPAYRRVLEREGAPSPGAVALVGDEAELERRLDALAGLGVTDLNAVTFPVDGDPDVEARTLDFLAERQRAAHSSPPQPLPPGARPEAPPGKHPEGGRSEAESAQPSAGPVAAAARRRDPPS